MIDSGLGAVFELAIRVVIIAGKCCGFYAIVRTHAVDEYNWTDQTQRASRADDGAFLNGRFCTRPFVQHGVQ